MRKFYQFTEGGGIAAPYKKAPVKQIDDVDFILLDLFCGAGGTTTGFDNAIIDGKKCAIIMACVNHDFKAIKSHWLNHPDVEHYEEDITTMYGSVKSFKIYKENRWAGRERDTPEAWEYSYYNLLFESPEMRRLKRLIDIYKAFYPKAKFILWASLECTNFSKAKGGLPRDQDSRTLADHLDRYIISLDPDYIQIENVVEFMSWGPLDDNGKPLSRRNGEDYMRWCKHINSLGYSDQWKELNSADFGAYTSRNRLFGCFAKPGLPIVWPEATHSKKTANKGQTDLFDTSLLKWKPVKDVLDFDDEGISIFNRKKPLSEKTLERIYAGMIKYVAGGKDSHDVFMQQLYACDSKGTNNYSAERPARTVTTRDGTAVVRTCFLSTYNTGNPESRNGDIEVPCKTLLGGNNHALVNCTAFIAKYYSGKPEGKVIPLTGPAGTIKTSDGQSLIQCKQFMIQRNGGNPEGRVFSLNGPARTITATAGNQGIVSSCFLTHYYGQGGQHSSVENPAPVIPTKARTAKIWLDKSYSGSGNHQSIDKPAGALTIRDHYATIQAYSFINRPFTNGGDSSSIEAPAGSILNIPKLNLVQAKPFIMDTNFNNVGTSIDQPSPPLLASRHHRYIVNPSHGGHSTSIDKPCPVIIARQDKAPLYLLYLEADDSIKVCIPVYDDEPPIMVKIKEFMWVYKIRDIKMRMLKVLELKLIQGFPSDYHLFGNQSDQKKFIGNSVHPLVPKYWSEALARKIRNLTTLN